MELTASSVEYRAEVPGAGVTAGSVAEKSGV
jgi:hypothetical protein